MSGWARNYRDTRGTSHPAASWMTHASWLPPEIWHGKYASVCGCPTRECLYIRSHSSVQLCLLLTLYMEAERVWCVLRSLPWTWDVAVQTGDVCSAALLLGNTRSFWLSVTPPYSWMLPIIVVFVPTSYSDKVVLCASTVKPIITLCSLSTVQLILHLCTSSTVVGTLYEQSHICQPSEATCVSALALTLAVHCGTLSQDNQQWHSVGIRVM